MVFGGIRRGWRHGHGGETGEVEAIASAMQSRKRGGAWSAGDAFGRHVTCLELHLSHRSGLFPRSKPLSLSDGRFIAPPRSQTHSVQLPKLTLFSQHPL